MEKKIILLFSLFFFISLVSAIPTSPTQTNVNINVGLQVQTQGIYYLQQNINHTFSFHVYNISTGFVLDDTTTNCEFHLFNKTGRNQFSNPNLSFVDDSFEIELIGSNFSELGTYSYYIHCNTSDYGGFSREVLKVTPDGIPSLSSGEGMVFIVSLASMFLMCMLFLFISKSFEGNPAAMSGSKEALGNPAAKFGFVALSFVVGIIAVLYSSVALMETFWGFDKIISSYSTFLYIILAILLLLFIFILINLFIRVIEAMRIKHGLQDK